MDIGGKRNKALKIAAGEWICFIGSDDVWADIDGLSKRVTLLKKQSLSR